MTDFGTPEQPFSPVLRPLAWEVGARMPVESIDAPNIPVAARLHAVRDWQRWSNLAGQAGEVVYEGISDGSITELPPRPDTAPRAAILRLTVDRRTHASSTVAARRR